MRLRTYVDTPHRTSRQPTEPVYENETKNHERGQGSKQDHRRRRNAEVERTNSCPKARHDVAGGESGLAAEFQH